MFFFVFFIFFLSFLTIIIVFGVKIITALLCTLLVFFKHSWANMNEWLFSYIQFQIFETKNLIGITNFNYSTVIKY